MWLLVANLLLLVLRSGEAVHAYGHAFGDVPNDFTTEQYAFIAATFPIFTVEKRHAWAVYGDSSQPMSSPFRYNSIAATVGTARKIKALNPAARVLMYWNSALHFNFYECEIDVQPAWLFKAPNGQVVYNYGNATFRSWWVACLVGALRNSSGAIDGIFLDALPKLTWAGQPAGVYSLWGAMVQEVHAAVPGTFIIYNGDYQSGSGAILAKSTDLIRYTDAVYAESMASIDFSSVKNAITFLRYLAASSKAEVSRGKLTFGHGVLGASNDAFKFNFALYLLITPDPATGYFLANDGYSINQGVLVPHPEYSLAFGLPLGNFSEDSSDVARTILSRNFTNATVTVDLKAKMANITMGLPPYGASATITPSATETPSKTSSPTKTPSPSTTASATLTGSGTPTPLITLTPSATPPSTVSLGGSASITSSAIPSPTATPSGSGTVSPSVTASISSSLSSSITLSTKATPTASQTALLTAALSRCTSSSVTPSGTPSVSESSSPSGSDSNTHTPSTTTTTTTTSAMMMISPTQTESVSSSSNSAQIMPSSTDGGKNGTAAGGGNTSGISPGVQQALSVSLALGAVAGFLLVSGIILRKRFSAWKIRKIVTDGGPKWDGGIELTHTTYNAVFRASALTSTVRHNNDAESVAGPLSGAAADVRFNEYIYASRQQH